jgi:hypothetical protein
MIWRMCEAEGRTIYGGDRPLRLPKATGSPFNPIAVC